MLTTASPSPPRRTPGPVVLVVGLFFVALGGTMFFAAGKLYFKQQEFLTHSERATGTVVDFEASIETNSRNHNERHTFYAPVFTFTDHSGMTRRVTSKTSHIDKPGYQTGQTLPVLYRRERPDEAELDTFFASWGGVTILGGMGVVFCVAGGAMAISGVCTMLRRNKKPDPPGMRNGGGTPRDPAILSGP